MKHADTHDFRIIRLLVFFVHRTLWNLQNFKKMFPLRQSLKK